MIDETAEGDAMAAYIIRYIGTEMNWEEIPIAGRNCKWQPGWLPLET